MPQAQGSSALSRLLHIQHLLVLTCKIKKKRPHYTLNTILHTNYTLQTCCHKSLNSQNLLSLSPSLSLFRLSHNFLFLNNQTCCLDTFVTKARLYRFFLHQTQSKRDGNVREKACWTLFTLCLVLDLPVHLSTREVGRVSGYQLATHEHPQIQIPLCCRCVDLLGPEQTQSGLV